MTETTYRFAPHPGGGFLLGLRLSQLCAFILAGLGALGALRLGGIGGLALAVAILAVAAGIVLIPVRGQTLEQWAPADRAVPARTLQRRRTVSRPARTARPPRRAPQRSP